MELFRTWAVTVCAFSILFLLLRMLLPSGRVQTACNMVLTLLTVFMLVAPFWNSFASGTLEFPSLSELEIQDIEEEQAYTLTLRSMLAQTLAQQGIETEEITLETELDHEHYLVLHGVKLTVKTPHSDAEIRDLLSKSLGIPPEIVTIERGTHADSGKPESKTEA